MAPPPHPQDLCQIYLGEVCAKYLQTQLSLSTFCTAYRVSFTRHVRFIILLSLPNILAWNLKKSLV